MGEVMAPAYRDRRVEEFRRISTWLQEDYERPEADRPLFVLFPEISMPQALVGEVDTLVEAMAAPTVVIGGLEYMSRAQFEELGSTLDLALPLDDVCEHLDGGGIVNTAALWLRRTDGSVVHFLQPKNHPFEPEAPHLCRGRLVGLFESADQARGRRFNFTVHVCADFASPDRVRRVLEECEEAKAGAHLDAAFVIQHQCDQSAEQFLDGAAAYFEAPEGGAAWADTSGASIVMINNAAERTCHRGHWGESQFKYQFIYRVDKRRLAGTDTYFIVDDGPHDTQSGVMRAVGPSAYLVHYKPRSLVRQVRGREYPEPFREAPCLHARLDGEQLHFKPLSAVPFWLKCEWIEAKAVFWPELEREDQVSQEMSEWWSQQWDQLADLWQAALGRATTAGMSLVESCMLLQRDMDGCPPTEGEPEEWGYEVRSAMDEFLRVFVLCRAWEANGRRIMPAPQGLRHALNPVGGWVSFVWGQGAYTADVIRRYREAMETDPAVLAAATEIVVVVLGPPRDHLDTARIREIFDAYAPINKQGLPDGSIEPVGEIAAASPPCPRFLQTQPLEGTLLVDSVEGASDLVADHLGVVD